MASDSPIEQLLAAIDRLDIDATMVLMEPGARLLLVDGRRAEGAGPIRELLSGLFAALRATSHRITAQWHQNDVWIAEVDASYELQDWLRLDNLPRVFVLREGSEGIADLRAYGAHEHPLAEHRSGEEGMWIGGRWVPPL